MGQVVSLKSRQKATKPVTRKRKRAKPAPKNIDHAFEAGVTFEVQSIYGEGSDNFAYRHRVRLHNKGGLAENMYDYGAHEYLVGDVSESIGVNKWSKPKFGILPTAHMVAIVLVEEAKPIAALKPTT